MLSPAGIEKLGELGKTFVAVASYKPEAGKRVVYLRLANLERTKR